MSKFMQARWADYKDGLLNIDANEQIFQMAKSQGTGKPLVSDNGFGADIIQFSAGKCVETHTHDGDHILLVLTGTGTVSYFDEVFLQVWFIIYLVRLRTQFMLHLI